MQRRANFVRQADRGWCCNPSLPSDVRGFAFDKAASEQGHRGRLRERNRIMKFETARPADGGGMTIRTGKSRPLSVLCLRDVRAEGQIRLQGPFGTHGPAR